jgi:hypothetical protein
MVQHVLPLVFLINLLILLSLTIISIIFPLYWAVLIFLVHKLLTFCCGYIGQVTCKRSATINKSGLNVASGVMMYS